MKPRLITENIEIVDEYSSFTRDELIKIINSTYEKFQWQSTVPVKFSMEIDETWHQYEPNSSKKAILKCTFVRNETPTEILEREKKEKIASSEQEAREKAEFDRLNKKFGAK